MKKIILIFMSLFFMISVSAEESVILPSEIGRVSSVKYIDTAEGLTKTKQLVDVKILSGKFRGENVQLENMISGNPYYDIPLKKNSKVVLHVEDNGNGVEYSIEDIKRSGTLLWLSLLFCGLLIYVGKKKGLYSLFAIGLTVLLICYMLSPMIIWGINPVLGTVLTCILSTTATMYLVGGINAKSSSAIAGTMLSLFAAGILSYISILTAQLTGFAGENYVFLFTAHPELNFISLTIATTMLATLGAVMDVAMSISSTINEIYETDNSKSIKELFVSGMNVGRDIIGTMANTLILVYLGGSLPLLLLAENIDIQKFANLNQVVTEVASALIGSIAIVICVPFTALVASCLIHKYAKLSKYDKINIG